MLSDTPLATRQQPLLLDLQIPIVQFPSMTTTTNLFTRRMLAGNYMESQTTGLPMASRGNHRTNPQIRWSLRTLNLANFSAAQLEQLCSLLSSNPTPSTLLMAQLGVYVSHANGLQDLGEFCIVDFSDSDHMTSCAHFFLTYSPSSGNHRFTLMALFQLIYVEFGTYQTHTHLTLC